MPCQPANTHLYPAIWQEWEQQTLSSDGRRSATILRVPRSWVYSHLSDLPVIRLGRDVRFKHSEVQRFLENRGPLPMTFVGANPRSRSKHHGKEIVMRERHQWPRVQDCGVQMENVMLGLPLQEA
jgi:hypothetical protein